jgi:hypothetical protein
MVEPPGIAPGSGPLITSAFIAIVRANPNRTKIVANLKNAIATSASDAAAGADGWSPGRGFASIHAAVETIQLIPGGLS